MITRPACLMMPQVTVLVATALMHRPNCQRTVTSAGGSHKRRIASVYAGARSPISLRLMNMPGQKGCRSAHDEPIEPTPFEKKASNAAESAGRADWAGRAAWEGPAP